MHDSHFVHSSFMRSSTVDSHDDHFLMLHLHECCHHSAIFSCNRY